MVIFPSKNNKSCCKVLNILFKVAAEDILANHTIKSCNSYCMLSDKICHITVSEHHGLGNRSSYNFPNYKVIYLLKFDQIIFDDTCELFN